MTRNSKGKQMRLFLGLHPFSQRIQKRERKEGGKRKYAVKGKKGGRMGAGIDDVVVHANKRGKR